MTLLPLLLLLALPAPAWAGDGGPVLPPAAATSLGAVQGAFGDTGTGWSLDRVQVNKSTVDLHFVGAEGPIDAVLSHPDDPGPGRWYALACDHPRCGEVTPALEALLTRLVVDDPWKHLAPPPRRLAHTRSGPGRGEPTPIPGLTAPPTDRPLRRAGLFALLLLGVLSTLVFSSDRPPGAPPA